MWAKGTPWGDGYVPGHWIEDDPPKKRGLKRRKSRRCDMCGESRAEMACRDQDGNRLRVCWKCYYTLNPRWIRAKGTPGELDYVRAHWEIDSFLKLQTSPDKNANRLPKEETKVKRYCYCRKDGYVHVPYGDIDIARYRLVAQWKLGRPLKDGEQVHHINGIKTDDRPENLQITNWKEHRAIHAANRALNGRYAKL